MNEYTFEVNVDKEPRENTKNLLNHKQQSRRESFEPSKLPVAARRALFENTESNVFKKAAIPSKTKHVELNPILEDDHLRSLPKRSKVEALKDMFEEKRGFEQKTVKVASHYHSSSFSKEPIFSPHISASSDEFKPDPQPELEFNEDEEVKEALDAFKEIDEISFGPSESSKNTSVYSQDNQKLALSNKNAGHVDDKDDKDDNKGDDFDDNNDDIFDDDDDDDDDSASLILDNFEDVDSPMGSSTKVYHETLLFDETTISKLPIKMRLKTKTTPTSPKKSQISPIRVPSPPGNQNDEEKKVAQINDLQTATPLRTLSMYRREQKLRKLCQDDKKFQLSTSSETKDNEEKAQLEFEAKQKAKMDELQIEARKYNELISQSLLALGHCIGVKNTFQRIEAEKILLINLKKREAIVNYIYHLKDEEMVADDNQVSGSFSIKTLLLGVRRDFLLSLSKVGGHGNVICNDQTIY